MHSIALSWCNFLKIYLFFEIANGFVKRIHVKIPRLNGFRSIRIVKQQFFDRFGSCWLIFWRWFQIQSIFLKKILNLLYFLLTLYSIFTQLVRKFDPICLLRTLLYSIFRLSIFTYTLGKIHFLLCFACFINKFLEEVSLEGHFWFQKCPLKDTFYDFDQNRKNCPCRDTFYDFDENRKNCPWKDTFYDFDQNRGNCPCRDTFYDFDQNRKNCP